MARLLRDTIGLVLLLILPVCETAAQERAVSPAADSVALDSTTAALDRFRAAEAPTPADTAAVRSWAQRLRAHGDSLEANDPARARSYLQIAYAGVRAVQDSVRMAIYLNDIGTTYYYQSRLDETLNYWRRALAINREVGRGAGVSGALNNIAIIYARRGQLDEALRRYREALQIDRERGAPDDVAAALNNIGLVHENQGRYDRALSRYRESLAIERRQENRTGIAQSLTNIANVHESRGEYRKALAQYQRAIDIHRQLENRSSLAVALNNAGICLKNLGRYDEALDRYRESLSIERDIGDAGGVASALSNIGTLQVQQGRLVVALDRFQEALRIEKDLDDPGGTAQVLTAIGDARTKQGRYDEALSRYRESLALLREIGDESGIATGLRSVGDVYRRQGEPEKARRSLREALELHRAMGERPLVAATLTALGETVAGEGRLDEALTLHREAFRIHRETGGRPGIATSLYHIGDLHLRQNRPAAAIDTLRRAVALTEELRDNATSLEARRTYLATQIDAYHALATAYARADRPRASLRALERARARQLAERLRGASDPNATMSAIPRARSLQATLQPTESAVLYANTAGPRPLLAVVVRRDTIATRELPRDSVLTAINRDFGKRIRAVRSRTGPLVTRGRAASTRSTAGNAAVSGATDGTGTLAESLRLYRNLLTQTTGLPRGLRASGPETAGGRESDRLGRHLHALLLEPIRPLLGDETKLILVPSGMLGLLPFETLLTTSGKYLVDDRAIRYAPSLTVLQQLQARTPPAARRSVLAFGGGLYRRPRAPASGTEQPPLVLADAQADGSSGRAGRRPTAGDRRSRAQDTAAVQTLDHTRRLLLRATRKLSRGVSPTRVYDQLGYRNWPDLPDSDAEVRRIGRIAGPGATVFTGRDVTESRLRLLDRTGRLDEYRWLHFATHGVAVTEAPDLSALVLSRVGASDSTARTDGYLTMNEIVDLRIRTNVTVLSACQSGLGRVVAGEGVVGLSHAFLQAGSNATLVSQWAVVDRSTRQFMTAVYRHARRPDTSFAEAVTKVKRAFIAGDYGAANRAPLRWAPFVYYGRE